MRFKFAEHADEISAAWIWARMVRLVALAHLALARGAGLRRRRQPDRPGRARRATCETRGGRVVLNAPVEQIVHRRRARHRRARRTARRCRPTPWSPRSPPPASAPLRPGPATATTCDRLEPHPDHRHLLPVPAPARAGDAVLLGQRARPARAVRGHDRVHEPQSRSRSWAATASSTCPSTSPRDDPRYAQTDEDVLRSLHGRAGPDQSRVRPALGDVRRRVPRPLRAADLPAPTTATTTPAHPDAGRRTCSSPTPASSIRTTARISGSFGLGIEAARRAASVGAEPR